jgi:ubiquinone biosynthesis protein UbiJ
MLAATNLHSLLDRLLATQPSLRARLAAHAGKSARIGLPLGGFAFTLGENGALAPLAPETPPDSVITLSADVLMRLVLGDKEALRQARVDGDGVLAADISAALDAFDWALALRPVLGDIAAARVDQAIAGFGAWRAKAHEAVGMALSEYAVHEAGMLASRPAVARFGAEVDALRDDVARLEARLALLEQGRAG